MNALQQIARIVGEKLALAYAKFKSHADDLSIHRTSAEIRADIVEADIPNEIARMEQVNDQLAEKVDKLPGRELMPSPGTDPQADHFLNERGEYIQVDERPMILDIHMISDEEFTIDEAQLREYVQKALVEGKTGLDVYFCRTHTYTREFFRTMLFVNEYDALYHLKAIDSAQNKQGDSCDRSYHYSFVYESDSLIPGKGTILDIPFYTVEEIDRKLAQKPDTSFLEEHVDNLAIHRTSAEIRADIVDADLPATIARVEDVSRHNASSEAHTDLRGAVGNIVEGRTVVGKAEYAGHLGNEADSYTKKQLDDRLDTYQTKTGDTCDNRVTFTDPTERNNLVSGDSHKLLFGKISRWFTDLKPLAFKEKVAKSDLDTDLQTEINGKATTSSLDNYISKIEKGEKNGLATLDASGRVPSSQLPSYVDDVLTYDRLAAFPSQGEDGKIYVTKDTNLTYRWSGIAYVEISPSLALGETSATAFRGDWGKTAYDYAIRDKSMADIKGLEDALKGKEPAFTKNTAFNKNFGNQGGTVCVGNDSRLSDRRVANGGNADTVGGISPSLFLTRDISLVIKPDDVIHSKYGFGYASNGWPTNGTFMSFGGNSNDAYVTQIQAGYIGDGVGQVHVRTRNDNSPAAWNPWYRLARANEIPSVPDWAKQPNKPTYAIAEIANLQATLNSKLNNSGTPTITGANEILKLNSTDGACYLTVNKSGTAKGYIGLGSASNENMMLASYVGDVLVLPASGKKAFYGSNEIATVNQIPASLPANGGTANDLMVKEVVENDAVPSANNRFQSFCVASSTAGGNDGYIWAQKWRNGNYVTQLYLDTDPTYTMSLRHRDTYGNWTAWKQLAMMDQIPTSLTVGATTKNLRGNSTVSFSLAEIGAQAARNDYAIILDNGSGYCSFAKSTSPTTPVDYIRGGKSGFLPFATDANGHGFVGTAGWPFLAMYAKTFYGNLSGNAVSASKMADAITITNFTTFNPTTLGLAVGEAKTFYSNSATGKPGWTSTVCSGIILHQYTGYYKFIGMEAEPDASSGLAMGLNSNGVWRGWKILARVDEIPVVPDWAKNTNKPTYEWSEIKNKPTYYETQQFVNDTRTAALTPGWLVQRAAFWFSNVGTPGSDWWSGIHINGWNNSEYAAWELCSPSGTSDPGAKSLYYRTGRGTTWNAWKKIAFTEDIPTKLPSPQVLTFTGAVSGTWDGSAAKTVNIPSLDGYATKTEVNAAKPTIIKSSAEPSGTFKDGDIWIQP